MKRVQQFDCEFSSQVYLFIKNYNFLLSLFVVTLPDIAQRHIALLRVEHRLDATGETGENRQRHDAIEN